MEEILTLLKDKIAEETKKENLNTSLIVELVDAYRRLSAFGAETIGEIGLSSSPLRIRGPVPTVGRDDGVFDELTAAIKGFKNLTAPQEMDTILRARVIFEKEKDEEMVQLIDEEIKRKVLGLLGKEKEEEKK